MTRKWRFWHTMTLIVSAAIASGQAIAQDDTPQTTADGLELVDSPLRAFYLRPGTTLDKYRRIVMLDSFVEFRKNWLRDKNRGKRSFNEITDEDMEYIKETLAGEFREVVTEALQEDGAYEIVGVGAADVLLLRPAVLNLDVGADIYGSRNQLADISTGIAMTLYVELYDSLTNTLIGRSIDSRSRSETDRAAVRRIIRAWADDLRDTLKEQ
jgi:hypothetical protein